MHEIGACRGKPQRAPQHTQSCRVLGPRYSPDLRHDCIVRALFLIISRALITGPSEGVRALCAAVSAPAAQPGTSVPKKEMRTMTKIAFRLALAVAAVALTLPVMAKTA